MSKITVLSQNKEYEVASHEEGTNLAIKLSEENECIARVVSDAKIEWPINVIAVYYLGLRI